MQKEKLKPWLLSKLIFFRRSQKAAEDEGINIEFGGKIHHTTVTMLSWWDRIKVLLGRKIIIDSDIICEQGDVRVIVSSAKTKVEPLFRRKPKGAVQFAMASPENSKEK